MSKCKTCANNLGNLHTKGIEFCVADLWDRQEDGFIKSDSDFNDYINKDRFCSDYSEKTK